MNAIIDVWTQHGTKILGYAAIITAAAIAVPGLLPPEYDKWLAFTNLVLGGFTVKRGFTNSKVAE